MPVKRGAQRTPMNTSREEFVSCSVGFCSALHLTIIIWGHSAHCKRTMTWGEETGPMPLELRVIPNKASK